MDIVKIKCTRNYIKIPKHLTKPENGWWEYVGICENTGFLLGWPIFRGNVSFQEGRWFKNQE